MQIINIIIIGSTHHNTYSMVRCFGEYGIKPIVILYGNDNSYVLKSSLVKMSYSAKDEAEAISILFHNKDQWFNSVIISCSDSIGALLDLNYDSLCRFYRFFNCQEQGNLTKNMNKLLQTYIAEKSGFCVPKSVEGYAHSLQNIDVPFPRIIKPVESIHGGKHIGICRDISSYFHDLQTFGDEDKVLVQNFIEKDYEIVVLGLSVGLEVIIPGYIQKHRDTKGGTTYSTVRKVNSLPESVVCACKKMSQAFNYEGLWGIELIKQGDNYYFVEMNLRNDATTYAMAVAGCNLPMKYYEYYSGVKEFDNYNITEIDSIVEFPDFIHVLKGNVGLIKWYKQLKACKCRYFYNEIDKEPYNQSKAEFIKMLRKRILKF